MNTKLLRRIQKQILKEPRQFDMSYWFSEYDGIPNCGTAACIAGWACSLVLKKNPRRCNRAAVAPWKISSHHLKIDSTASYRLYYIANWPKQFRDKYKRYESTSPTRAAKVAVARIDHFIKTKGRE